jgi:hypothetical protein
MLTGTWRIATAKGAATLTVVPFAPIAAVDQAAIATEAERLLAFIHPDIASREIRFDEPREQRDSRSGPRRVTSATGR